MQLLNDVEDLIHQDGGKAHGRLIQHHKLGLAHKGPGHSQHLLLAAGQCARNLLAALLQAGKALENLLNGIIDLAARTAVATHFQIFPNRHMLEDPPSLRAQGHAKGNDPVGRQPGNHLAIKGHGSRLGL